ncbi:MAG: hypothetical protein JWN04_5368 [Myxococcaceae bacterium]|nr:hypothetical protein [Myxococcaceae bacterium]
MEASRAVERSCLQSTRARGGLGIVFVSAFSCLAFTLGGCKVGSDDIEYWKGTVKGPGKIIAVMLADKYPVELRTQAALALVDMERTDRDGTSDLQQALQNLEEPERNELIKGMVPGLEQLMKQAEPPAPGAPAGAPSPRQIRAKDAAFLLVTNAPADVKPKLTDDVIAWYMEDFNGRSLAGNYSAEQVVRALGPSSAKELSKGLKARMPAPALVKMSQLIGQVADPQSKNEAGAKLVAIADEMQGKDFLAWVRQTVKEQAERQNLKLDVKKLEVLAESNRDNFINDGAVPAMKWLADAPIVKKRLLSMASTPAPGEAGTTRRTRALQALEGKVSGADLHQIMPLALGKENPTSVRDYAFDRIGDIRSPEALPALWPLVSSTEDARLRWRAGELVLAIGGAVVVPDFISRLPSGADYAPEELEGYATRLSQISPAPSDTMRSQLASSNWYARVIAARFFERKGNADDVRRLDALSNDKASVKGPRWGKTKTVGDVATEAATAAKQRLAQPGAM